MIGRAVLVQPIDTVEIVMLVMTLCGVAVSSNLVRMARYRVGIAQGVGDVPLLLVAKARLEHERYRCSKQGMMLALAIFCLTDAPPPPMTQESFVVRVVFILLSMAMVWTSLRAEVNDGRIRAAIVGAS
jgi:hypothetical protein